MANFPTWKIGLMYEEPFEFEIQQDAVPLHDITYGYDKKML